MTAEDRVMLRISILLTVASYLSDSNSFNSSHQKVSSTGWLPARFAPNGITAPETVLRAQKQFVAIY